jgi:eukaryotic-like serine/threonine-protein kinase
LLEKNAQHDEAAMAYMDAGEPDEAARVLAAAKRFKNAGHLLLRTLEVAPEDVATLDAAGKQRALNAAVYLSRGGENGVAYKVFVALGDYPRALKVLEELGDKVAIQRLREQMNAMGYSPEDASRTTQTGVTGTAGAAGAPTTLTGNGMLADAQALEQAGRVSEAYAVYFRLKEWFHAARMAAALGRHAEAAALLDSAQLHYEAAVCYRTAGNERGVLESLKKLSPSHPSYRRACQIAIQIAPKFGAPDPLLLNFLKPFRLSAPADERDAEAFFAFGIYAQEYGMLDIAYSVLRMLAGVLPGYRDVVSRVAILDAELRNTSARVVGETGAIEDPDDRGERARGVTAQRATGARAPVRDSGKMLNGSSAEDAGEPRDKPSGTGKTQRIAADSLEAGDVIAERYHVEGLLGRGGMACVYKVRDVELEDDIAMKVFSQQLEDPQLLGRFKQEVMLSRQLSHPNIVRLYDFGTHAGLRFITMELLTGSELSALTGKPMDLETGLGYLIGACAGLEAVHKRGVVHRDLKPANFFVNHDGVLKIMDFGIAKKQGTGDGMTVQGFFAGTPEYMSPEQIQSFSKVNHLSDLYAMGVIAYELFVGGCPFAHEEMASLLMMHLTHAPRPPRELRAEIPEELEAIILQLLEKDQKKRIQSCDELGKRLLEVREHVRASVSCQEITPENEALAILEAEPFVDDGGVDDAGERKRG